MSESGRQEKAIPRISVSTDNAKRRSDSGDDNNSNNNGETHLTTTATLDVEKVIGTQLGEIDENTVWWDGENDAANPHNWPRWKKVVNLGLITTLTFVIPLSGTMFVPAVPTMMRDFNKTSKALTGFVASESALGNLFGPLLIAPLSEMYGRAPVYHVCNVFLVAVMVGCAFSPSLSWLIVFRFLGGLFGCCPSVVGGGSIVDILLPQYRGTMIACWSLGYNVASLIGPVAGGFIAGNPALGWRWTFKFVATLQAVMTVAMFALASESYAPVLLRRKALKLRRATGNALLHSRLDMGMSHGQYLKHSFLRPFKILVRSPYALILGIYTAIAGGFFSLVATSIAPLFQRIYHIPTSYIGLAFLGITLGSLTGLIWVGIASFRMKEQLKKDGGDMKAEHRLRLLPIGATLVPIGYLIYGWTAQFQVHYIVPILAHYVL